MMNNVHILSNEEYEELMNRIRDLEGDCMWLSHKWEMAEKRFNALYEEHNREAREQLDAASREELLQWCEKQSAKYEELDYRAWCEEQAHLWNDGVLETAKRWHCEPEDLKYYKWCERSNVEDRSEGWDITSRSDFDEMADACWKRADKECDPYYKRKYCALHDLYFSYWCASSESVEVQNSASMWFDSYKEKYPC